MSGLQQVIAINAWAACRECAALQGKADSAKDKQRKAEAEAWRARENLGLGQRSESLRAMLRTSTVVVVSSGDAPVTNHKFTFGET